jgi:hypothetical protein
MNPLFGPILELISTPITHWLDNKNRKQELKAAIDTKQIELVSNAQNNEALWEIEAVKAGNTSWKDEYVTFVISLPAVLCFVWPDVVYDGFHALERSPDWYQWTFLTVMLAAVGINVASKIKNKFSKDE